MRDYYCVVLAVSPFRLKHQKESKHHKFFRELLFKYGRLVSYIQAANERDTRSCKSHPHNFPPATLACQYKAVYDLNNRSCMYIIGFPPFQLTHSFYAQFVLTAHVQKTRDGNSLISQRKISKQSQYLTSRDLRTSFSFNTKHIFCHLQSKCKIRAYFSPSFPITSDFCFFYNSETVSSFLSIRLPPQADFNAFTLI